MKLIQSKTMVIHANKLMNQPHNDDEQIDLWELTAANRAVTNLRKLLYEDKMLALLKNELAESFTLNKKYADTSDNDFNYGQLILQIEGITSEILIESVTKLMNAVKGSTNQARDMMFEQTFVVHPEHYALGGGNIETMGGHPVLTKPMPTPINMMPKFIRQFVDDTQYAIVTAGSGPLQDDTPFTYVLQQYKNTDNGMEANLMIWYPANCPDNYVEEHIEHYAVEFRNGCRMALQRQSQSE
ncbi:hypothetical protein [Lactiplantibacillus daowaiensis]|uniref:hypothetical protein n=1 Tax=Lactiplantibacillus daowaiensis TaxID=2559918 RepID=UPI0010F7268B|nr:hypothetical protein [Lactiplantibacillus daowaiensis]